MSFIPEKIEPTPDANYKDYLSNIAHSKQSLEKFLINKINSIFNKQLEGVDHLVGWDSAITLTAKSNKIFSDAISPFGLARLLGFSKSVNDVIKELENSVPTGSGKQIRNEYIGNDVEKFKQKLGITNESLDLLADIAPMKELLDADAGVQEGLSVGTHSILVVYMFDQYLAHLFKKQKIQATGLTLDKFRLFLMLHDIGKGLAVKEEGTFGTARRKEKELAYCQNVIDKIEGIKLITNKESRLFKALLDNVSIGEFLVKSSDVNLEDKKTLNVIARNSSTKIKEAYQKFQLQDVLDIDAFFSLSTIFHRADAGAYKFLRTHPHIFQFGKKIGDIYNDRIHMRYQEGAKIKLKELKAEIYR